MGLKQFIKKIVYPHRYSNEAYTDFLRKNGVVVGSNVTFYSPVHIDVDIRRPWLIKIGDHCKITKHVTILAHDYSVSVPRRVYGSFVGGGLPVTIGNNVFIGEKATILMGTRIGDNSIIGANSLVKGEFPEGSVIAGNPAKVICSLEEYYKKNLDNCIENAKLCAQTIFQNSGHLPTIEEMTDAYAWLYLPRNEETVQKYNRFFTLSSDDYDDVVRSFMRSEPIYDSFESFLKSCGLID